MVKECCIKFEVFSREVAMDQGKSVIRPHVTEVCVANLYRWAYRKFFIEQI